MWTTLARAREGSHPMDAVAVYRRQVLALIDQKKTPAYRAAVDLMARIRQLATAAGQPDEFGRLLDRVRNEHRAKRNLRALLDERGWRPVRPRRDDRLDERAPTEGSWQRKPAAGSSV